MRKINVIMHKEKCDKDMRKIVPKNQKTINLLTICTNYFN